MPPRINPLRNNDVCPIFHGLPRRGNIPNLEEHDEIICT